MFLHVCWDRDSGTKGNSCCDLFYRRLFLSEAGVFLTNKSQVVQAQLWHDRSSCGCGQGQSATSEEG